MQLSVSLSAALRLCPSQILAVLCFALLLIYFCCQYSLQGDFWPCRVFLPFLSVSLLSGLCSACSILRQCSMQAQEYCLELYPFSPPPPPPPPPLLLLLLLLSVLCFLPLLFNI